MIDVIRPTTQHQDASQPSPSRSLWPAAAFAAVLIAGTALRLWKPRTSPAWQWDKAVYWRPVANVQHGVLAEHPVFGAPWEPFLYQPPLYLLVVARWFDLIGASIYHARLHGGRTSLLAVIPVVFDGRLLYIERVSYMENALMLIVVAAFLFYQQALDRPSWQRFAVVGLAARFAAPGSYNRAHNDGSCAIWQKVQN